MMTKNDFLIYKTDDGKISIDVHMNDETVWLTQEQMGAKGSSLRGVNFCKMTDVLTSSGMFTNTARNK